MIGALGDTVESGGKVKKLVETVNRAVDWEPGNSLAWLSPVTHSALSPRGSQFPSLEFLHLSKSCACVRGDL